jgi:hypothetical protein
MEMVQEEIKKNEKREKTEEIIKISILFRFAVSYLFYNFNYSRLRILLELVE